MITSMVSDKSDDGKRGDETYQSETRKESNRKSVKFAMDRSVKFRDERIVID
jgi:hypothetical protein